MRFIPSDFSYGSAPVSGEPTQESAPDDYSKYLEYLTQAAPSLSILLAGQDPREKEAVLTAKLAQYKDLRSKAKSQLTRNYYTSQINEIQAELAAVQARAGPARETEALFRAGKIGGLVVVVLGSAVLIQLFSLLRAKTKAAQA